MHEALMLIAGYLHGIWRHRWAALLAAWGVAVAGWIFVAQMQEQYRATARVHVDSNTVLRPLLRGLAVQPNISQRADLMTRTLLSRPNLEKLVLMADLDVSVQADTRKDQILDSLKERVSLSADRRNSSLYLVSFTHENPDVAKRVVQSLLTVFIESNLGHNREDRSDAESFLDKQIVDYERRLSEAEGRLAEFKQRHAGTLPGSSGGFYQRLTAAREELKVAQLQYGEMQNRRDELRHQLADMEADPSLYLGLGSDFETMSPLDVRIQTLQSRVDELLTRYTERHPEIVQIRSLIAELEQQRQERITTALEEGDTEAPGLQENPTYQQTRALLTEADATLAELRVRVGEHEHRLKDLEGKVNSIPQIEAELTRLDRDYGVIKDQYNGLLKRRESARISGDVELSARDVVFRVIDPPFVPQKPNQPNKLLLNSIVLVIATVAFAGFGLLLSLVRPVFVNATTLGEMTGLPVFGTVTAIVNAELKRRQLTQLLTFCSLAVLLLALYAGVNLPHLWLLG